MILKMLINQYHPFNQHYKVKLIQSIPILVIYKN